MTLRKEITGRLTSFKYNQHFLKNK